MASQEDVTSDPGDQEGTIDLIRLDVSRTFPHLCIFQKVSLIFCTFFQHMQWIMIDISKPAAALQIAVYLSNLQHLKYNIL